MKLLRLLGSLASVLPVIVQAQVGGTTSDAAAPVDAGASSAFSLRSALGTALRQNPALRVRVDGIEQKEGVADQASGAFDWNTVGGVEATKVRNPTLGLPGTEPVDSSTQTSYSVGGARLFRNGISIQPSVAASVVDTHSSNSPTTGVAELRFQVDIPLLRGLGSDSTGAVEAAARGDVRVARLLYRHALAAQAYGTAASYWSSRAADQILLLQRDVERSAERLVESTKVLVETRVFPPAFLLQAEANLRDKRTVRIGAELTAQNARIALGRALGGTPEAIIRTPAPADAFPELPAAAVTPSEALRADLVRRALGRRADVAASRETLVPLNLLARQAELDLRPRVDLTLNAGYNGLSTGSNYVAPLRERLTGANGSVGVSLAWPYRNTYQRGVLRERRADIRVAEAEAADLSLQVASEVLIALEQVRLRADVVRGAQDTVEISRKALAAQYDQLKSGEGTILDVISLENLSVSARVKYVEAHAAYASAIAQLRYAIGAVFDESSSGDSEFGLSNLAVFPSL